MQIKAPSGRVYNWNSQGEPTQEDIDALVKYEASLPPPEKGFFGRLAESFVESQKSEEQKNREVLARAEERLMGRRVFAPEEPQAGDVTTVGEAATALAKQVGPTAVRVGGPIAAVASIPTGVGTVPALTYLAGAGLLSENVARAIEGRAPTDLGEGALAAATSATLTPMRLPVGLARAAAAGTLEGLGLASAGAVQQGRSPFELTPTEIGIGLGIGIGGRGIESAMMARRTAAAASQTQKTYQAIANDQKAANAAAEEAALIAKQQADARNEAALAGINTIQETAGTVTPVDIFRARASVEGQLKATAEAAKNRAKESAEVLLSAQPRVAASESASVIDAELARRETLAQQFAQARNELRAAELDETLRLGQIGQGEDIILATGRTPEGRAAQLDVRLGIGEGAASERARLAAMEAAPRAAVEAEMARPLPRMSAQASRMADQYGFIDPRILAPMARAGIGFAAGVAQGDTPEEDIGYGLLYAATGAALSPSLAKRAGNALLKNTDLGRKWVPEATLAPFMDVIRASGRDAEALLVSPKIAYQNLKNELELIKDPVQRDAANIAVYEYLTGNRNVSTLPKTLGDAAMDARVAIDDLTDELIRRGLAKGELRDTLVSNTGAYLRRSYRIFADPKWRPSQATFDKWVREHVNDALSNPQNKRTQAELTEYFTATANDLLDRNAEEFVTTGAFRSGNEIFKPRKNLGATTRELLGEINDPLFLFSDTAPRMARSAANFEMKKQIVDIGEKLGLFSRTPSSTVGASVRMAPENKPFEPFAGVYSSPEIRQAWQSISNRDTSELLRWFATASSSVKLPLTLGSLKGYASNIWGGVMDVAANGHGTQFLNPDNWAQAISSATTGFKLLNNAGKINKGKAIDFYRSLVNEGLINKSVSGEDFVRTLEQSRLAKTGGAGRKLIDNLSRAYMMPESMSKVFILNGELSTIKQAFPGMSDAEAFKVAAARTRATSQDYDYLPSSLKKLSQFGGLDPFISYTADRFRVVYNAYRIALEDLASGNPVLRRAGAKRIASMTAVLAAAGTIGVNSHLSKEEEEALRRRLPDRDMDGFLRISERQPDGSFTYTNLNYNIPQTIVTEAAAAAMRGDSPSQSAKRFASVVGQQLFGANLVISPILDVSQNRTESGQPIYTKNQPFLGKALDATMYLGSKWFVPLVIPEIKKAYEATKQVAAASGQKYNLADMALSNFAGIRKYRIDLPTKFRVDAARLGRDFSDDQTVYSNKKRNLIGEDDKNAAYLEFEAKRRFAWQRASQIVKDARTLGYNDSQVVDMLKGGIPSRLLLGAMEGIYLPSSKVETIGPAEQFEEWESKGIKSVQDIRNEISKIARTDRPRAISLINHLRESIITERRGVTPTDKLLLSMPVSDGSRADYIMVKINQLAAVGDAKGIIRYRDELKKKRIINPDVLNQIKSRAADNPELLRILFSK